MLGPNKTLREIEIPSQTKSATANSTICTIKSYIK